MRYDLSATKDWKAFLDTKLMKQYFPGSVQDQHVQTNAPLLKYQPPIDNLTILEEQIKKYLAGRFEDERIAQVKKTTNWNIHIGEELKKVLIADKKLNDEHLKAVKENFDPAVFNDRRRTKKHGDFQPTEAEYTKYFIANHHDNILKDFEEYMSCAR